jgi:hypothetical protein
VLLMCQILLMMRRMIGGARAQPQPAAARRWQQLNSCSDEMFCAAQPVEMTPRHLGRAATG